MISYKSKISRTIIISICLLFSGCNIMSPDISQMEEKNGGDETNQIYYNGIEMVDENGDMLKSRIIELDSSKKFTLKLFNTNKNVSGEKVYLILNGKQYDLNEKNENLKTVLLENDYDELSFDVKFDDLKDGKYYGVFIAEHQLREPSRILENQGYSRFIINKGDVSGSLVYEDGTNILSTDKIENKKMKNELDKCIDFAVFTEEQTENENFLIKNINSSKNSENKEDIYYAYIYNNTKHKVDYAISLISADEIMTSNYSNSNIILGPGEDGVYKVEVPTEKIKINSPYYFVLIRYPLLNMDESTIQQATKEGKNIELSFSQKFILEN